MDIVESTTCTVPLDADGAAALERLGRQLVSAEAYWGDSRAEEPGDAENADTGEGEPDQRSAIRCSLRPDGTCTVRVHNRIGVIRVGDLQLRVLPKVDSDHVMWLLRSAPELGLSLTSADAPVLLEAGGGFWEVLAHYFVWSSERLLRGELIRDYRERRDELTYSRGRIRTIDTTRSLMRGRMLFAVEYEEFSIDTPLNRVLRRRPDAWLGAVR